MSPDMRFEQPTVEPGDYQMVFLCLCELSAYMYFQSFLKTEARTKKTFRGMPLPNLPDVQNLRHPCFAPLSTAVPRCRDCRVPDDPLLGPAACRGEIDGKGCERPEHETTCTCTSVRVIENQRYKIGWRAGKLYRYREGISEEEAEKGVEYDPLNYVVPHEFDEQGIELKRPPIWVCNSCPGGKFGRHMSVKPGKIIKTGRQIETRQSRQWHRPAYTKTERDRRAELGTAVPEEWNRYPPTNEGTEEDLNRKSGAPSEDGKLKWQVISAWVMLPHAEYSKNGVRTWFDDATGLEYDVEFSTQLGYRAMGGRWVKPGEPWEIEVYLGGGKPRLWRRPAISKDSLRHYEFVDMVTIAEGKGYSWEEANCKYKGGESSSSGRR